MRAFFRKVFGGETAPATVTSAVQKPRLSYPPIYEGVPIATTDELLATQTELIQQTRKMAPLDDKEFEAVIMPVIRAYAAYVHLLPASESHHHRTLIGLLHHGLDVGLRALNKVRGSSLTSEMTPPSKKQPLERRWQVAAFVAGLGHDLGKPVTDLRVSNREGDRTWNPFMENIEDWARRYGVDTYFLRWVPGRLGQHQQMNGALIHKICGPEFYRWMGIPGQDVLQALMQFISLESMTPDTNPLKSAVKAADSESVAANLLNWRTGRGEIGIGVPAERFLVDAMRRLIDSGKWKVNSGGSPLWYLQGRLFIAWRRASVDIQQELAQGSVPGVPRQQDDMAEILIQRGVAIPYTPEKGGAPRRYWDIRVVSERAPGANYKITLSALALASPEILFAFQLPSADGEVVEPGAAPEGEGDGSPAGHPGNEEGGSESPPALESTPRAPAAIDPTPSEPMAAKAEEPEKPPAGAEARPVVTLELVPPVASPAPEAPAASGGTAKKTGPEATRRNGPKKPPKPTERPAKRPDGTRKRVPPVFGGTRNRSDPALVQRHQADLVEYIEGYVGVGQPIVNAYGYFAQNRDSAHELRREGGTILISYPTPFIAGTDRGVEWLNKELSGAAQMGLVREVKGGTNGMDWLDQRNGASWVRLNDRLSEIFAILLDAS